MTSALDGSIAEYAWLLPLLPLLGALINGFLAIAPRLSGGGSRGSVTEREDAALVRHAGSNALVSIVAPGVMLLAFGLAVAIFVAMSGVALEAPFVRTY